MIFIVAHLDVGFSLARRLEELPLPSSIELGPHDVF